MWPLGRYLKDAVSWVGNQILQMITYDPHISYLQLYNRISKYVHIYFLIFRFSFINLIDGNENRNSNILIWCLLAMRVSN